MSGSILDVIVVGGGYAGLCASYYLKHFGLEHRVFERGRIGQSWHSQGWDSFTLVTSNQLNWMPGSNYAGDNPFGFPSAEEFIASMDLFVLKNQLPVSEHANVVSIVKTDLSPYFSVSVVHDNDERTYFCWRVLIASGSFTDGLIPSFANRIHSSINQFHVRDYKRPAQFRDGAVLVVGSGQSGCQVTEELLADGRRVYLSTSRVGRLPRRYRGKDIMDWLVESKFFTSSDLGSTNGSPALAEPLLSGVGEQGHTIGLQALVRRGAVLLGSMETADGINTFFVNNLADHIRFADEFSRHSREFIDEYIARKRLGAPSNEDDADDIPSANPASSPVRILDLGENNIDTIVWATGYKGDVSYVKLPITDGKGNPVHKNGVADVEGIYFLGFPFLRNRKSNHLFGIKDDAGFICNSIYASIR